MSDTAGKPRNHLAPPPPHVCIDCPRVIRWGLARCVPCAVSAGDNFSYMEKTLQSRASGISVRVSKGRRPEAHRRLPKK